MAHAMHRKRRFNKKVHASRAGIVEFKQGNLVQYYRSDLHSTLHTEKKLMPMWLTPHQVTKRLINSYELETVDDTPLEGEFSARRLRSFTPKEGTLLVENQTQWEQTERERRKEEDEEEDKVEMEDSRKSCMEGQEREKDEDEEDEVRDLEAEKDERCEADQENQTTVEDVSEDDSEDNNIETESKHDTIASRIAMRQQGRCHIGGGQID
jgi:hypothetical protein